MPTTSKKIFNQLNTDVNDYESVKSFGGLKVDTVLNNPEPLFNRIDVKNK